MRYRLRTLLILLAVLPPLLWFGWGKYQAWKAEQGRRAALLNLELSFSGGDLGIIPNVPKSSPPQSSSPDEN